MSRERLDRAPGAQARSAGFARFLRTRRATALAAVMALAALVGAAVAVGHHEWVDAGVRLALAAGFGAWTLHRVRRPRSRPPDLGP